jgi:hypothetical protein
MSPTPAITLKPGAEVHGFRLHSATAVPEVRSVAYQLEHPASGARLLHLHTEDPENLFSVTFPTPSSDDTGVPHILEHCVLAGSRRFPVREPFFEMIKMSMATFINAMTGEDATYYPVASNVPKDLFNLAEVYFDAVFHPLLTEQTFRREGHHLAPAAADGSANGSANGAGNRLAISGIVYNEMKGAFSDPDASLARLLNHGLLPDTIYAHESGGTPDAIPDLSYEAFRDYHANFYHPSNGYFFAYGDIATADYCAFLNRRLAGFASQTVTWPAGIAGAAFAPNRQRPWPAPRSLRERYPIGANEPDAERTYLINAWLTGDALDPVDAALMRVLSLILAGNEAAPLRRAVVASGLGADLTYSGSSSVGHEATFVIGIRGSEADRADRFAELIDTTLRDIAAGSISAEMVETGFRQAAFEYLEVQPMFPLHTLFRVVGSWIYGADPLRFLRLGTHLAECRERWQREPDLFARLLRERLIDNPHRLNVVMSPDRAMQGELDERLQARVGHIESAMTEEQIAAAGAAAAELAQLNSTPNTPEQLASLPQLRVSDLPAALQHVATEVTGVSGITLLRNDVFSNGVNYLAVDFDLTGLPAEMWPYLPRYLEAIGKLGVAGANYQEIARRKAAATGGVRASLSLGHHGVHAERTLRGVRFSLKALDDQMEEALSLLGSLIFGVDPRDRDRLREVLIQERQGYRTGLVRGGARTAGLHAGRGLNLAGHLAEIAHGLPQLALCETLAGEFDARRDGRHDGRHDDLMGRIEQIRDFLLARDRLTVSHTGTERGAGLVTLALADWSGTLRAEPVADADLGFTPFAAPPREGLAAQMDVAYCAQVFGAPHISHPDAVPLEVGAHIVNLDWILPEIRFKGNAYGAWFRYDAVGGSAAFGSYRDPHIVRTLDVFARARDFVHEAAWSDAEIGRAIIAVAKRGFTPLRPRPANGLALQRYLAGITPAMREARHEQLKSVTPEAVKAALERLLAGGLAQAPVCVVSSRAMLEQANRELAGNTLAISEILQSGAPVGGAPL